jgi:hypothetical protein
MISNDLFKHDLDDYHIPTFLGRPRPGWIHEIKHDGFEFSPGVMLRARG